MIRFTLTCDQGHRFESWFKSSDAFDSVKASGMLSCPTCGSTDVGKALMAPDVRTGRSKDAQPGAATHALAAPDSRAEAALKELRQRVQNNSEYVGKDFAAEARRIHLGEAEERSIYGEATGADASKLIEDGIPVAPLPFIPDRKSN